MLTSTMTSFRWLPLLAAVLLPFSLTGCQILGNLLRVPASLLNSLTGQGGGSGLMRAASTSDPSTRGENIESRGDYQPQSTPSILEAGRVASRSASSPR